jgi:glycosyltransferase involved in cell wall biosynthesis
MAQGVVISWPLSSYFGWGVYGLNLALHWASDQNMAAASAAPPHHIMADPLRLATLQPFMQRSAQLQVELDKNANGRLRLDIPMLEALGHTLQATRTVQNVLLEGQPSIGVTFLEEKLSPGLVDRFKRYPLIVTGSTWNEKMLRAYGIDRVRTVLQGVDQAVFHPAPGNDVFPDRFLVFSGGKAELRKGQDIVLAAFKIFADRHPEALLVTSWHSPWPQVARTLDRSGIAAPVVFDQQGALDVSAWAKANRIADECVLDLRTVPNVFMPPILREMDVAVFPNRAEGGTNLVAMECMACGVPVVLARNTGHLDLIEDGNCYPLDDQRPLRVANTSAADGWGESQVEEIVERLEQVFTDRAEARRSGARAAQSMSRLTWAETARQMKAVVLELAGAAAVSALPLYVGTRTTELLFQLIS